MTLNAFFKLKSNKTNIIQSRILYNFKIFRDCGSDPTCVLCSSCFRKSKHREHRYKMTTSGGGGYCDCGDPEAWKSHPNCELHMPKAKGQSVEESSESYINKLPQDLAQRATELFTYLLEYIFEVMSIENKEDLPVHLKSEYILRFRIEIKFCFKNLTFKISNR